MTVVKAIDSTTTAWKILNSVLPHISRYCSLKLGNKIEPIVLVLLLVI